MSRSAEPAVFVWPHCWDVQSCSSLSPCWCSCSVRRWFRGVEGVGCFVPRWNACHSDVPGRKSSRGHNGIQWRSRVVNCFFSLSAPASIWSIVLKLFISLANSQENAHIAHTCADHTVSCTLCFMCCGKQKTPVRGCSVMRDYLIVNMLHWVFHLTAGQKRRAIKFGSSEASTV